ncbi:MAG: NADH-quinone oxidoreductase subunit N [Candidatus Micrarchaeia archaeon]
MIFPIIVLALLLVFGDLLLWFFDRPKINFAFSIVMLALLAMAPVAFSQSNQVYLGLVSANPFAAFFFMLFSLGMLLVNVLAYAYSGNYSDFSVLSGFALMGMFCVSFAASLLLIFIGLELVSLPSVFIVLLSRRNSLEAATKYLVMSALAIAVFAFATVLVFGSTGSLALPQTANLGYSVLAFVLFFSSLGFDAAQFPFGILLPDIYEGSSSYATAMLGGVNKKLGFAALIQIVILLFVSLKASFVVAAVFATLTMFYGNIVALTQTNLKRLFAYSSISQAGYIMIGIATGTALGIASSLVQIFAHMFLFIGILAIVAWLEKNSRNDIDSLIGLSSENAFAALSMTVFMLALVGLPFTLGFVGKFMLFLNATVSGLLWLAILGIINSIISIFYYAKAITAIFTRKYQARKERLGYATFSVVLFCLLLVVLLGIYPNPLISFATSAAQYLFGI